MTLQLLNTLIEKLDRLERLLPLRKPFITPRQAAQYMQVNVQQINRLLQGRRPKLKSKISGQRTLIARAELLAYLGQSQTSVDDEITALSKQLLSK